MASDYDGDTLTYSVTGSASNGTTSVSGDTITYTPAANYNGTDSFIVTADDGNGGTATQTINVTVNAVDEPVASGPTFRLMTFSGWSGSVAGDGNVFGSSGSEAVSLLAGNITFDASFNRGGDTIVLDLNAGQYTAVRSGSAVVLTADNETFTIPVGTSGLTLSFADGDRTLVFSSGFKIGDDTITSTPTALTPSTTTVSIDVGTDSSRTQVDGSSGATTFTDDASVTTNVQIINFTADDVIAVTNATASDYNYSSNDLDGGGTANDLELSYTNAVITNSIYILNAIADPNAFIFDQTTAQDAIGFSFISFG